MINVTLHKSGACVSNRDFHGEFSVLDHLMDNGVPPTDANKMMMVAWNDGFSVDNILNVGTVSISYR